MDREQTEELARKITQALIDHCYVSEADRYKAVAVTTMELNKELVEPLERLCEKMTIKQAERKPHVGGLRIS
jgi:hypothetical protein